MVKGYRLAIVAVVVITLLVGLATYTAPTRSSLALEQSPHSSDVDQSFSVVRHPLYGFTVIARAEESRQNSSSPDLLAQEIMAHWTMWIGIFTAAGLASIVLTLAETRQVTKITREIGVAQTVAYPSIDKLEFISGDRDGDALRIIINSLWKNVGNTPAFEFEGKHHLKVQLEGAIVLNEILNTNEESGLRRIDAGSSETLHSAPDHFSFADYIEALESETIAISVEVIGSYRTAFDTTEKFQILFESSRIYFRANAQPGVPTFDIKMARVESAQRN
mgnify:CR=1 FL=1